MRDRISIVDINSLKFEVLHYKQYDNNLSYTLLVQDGKNKVDFRGYIATAFFKVPSGKIYNKFCTPSMNLLTTILDNNILGEEGRVEVEIVLSNGDRVVTTFTTYIEVQKSIDRNDYIISNPQWDIIKELIDIRNEDFQPTIDKLTNRITLKLQEYEDKWNEITGGGGTAHAHTNLPILEKITQQKLDNWNNKVDRVEGMDLSKNNYTDEDMEKVRSIDLSVLADTKYVDEQIRTHNHPTVTKDDIDDIFKNL